MYSEMTLHHRGGRSHWPESTYHKIAQIDAISTMSIGRVHAIIEDLDHITRNGIQGDVAEFGVYRGGNIALLAYEVWHRGLGRNVLAYDTFSGVPLEEVGDADTELCTDRPRGSSVVDRYVEGRWCYCTLDSVRDNVASAISGMCGGSQDLGSIISPIRYVSGSVLDTIPRELPDRIAFLRLDMDIAIPTRHVLPHVWARMPMGAIMHIDDYNAFNGVHGVIDEFLRDKKAYVHEIDHTAISILRLE